MSITLGHYLTVGAMLFCIVGDRDLLEPQKPHRAADGN